MTSLLRTAAALAFVAALSAPAMALTLNVTDDTFVGPGDSQSDHVAGDDGRNNWGASPLVRVGDTHNSTRLGFVRFDLSPLPATTKVTSAFLRVFVHEAAAPGSLSIFEVGSQWSEATLSANGALPKQVTPAIGSFAVAATDVGKYIDVDVTKAVRDWLAFKQPAPSIILAWGWLRHLRLRSRSLSTRRRTSRARIRWSWRSPSRVPRDRKDRLASPASKVRRGLKVHRGRRVPKVRRVSRGLRVRRVPRGLPAQRIIKS